MQGEQLKDLYGARFSTETPARNELWEVLCRHFFQKWIDQDAVVLDLAAGHCEFINHIQARRRLAVDLNPAVVDYAADGVEATVSRSDDLSWLEDSSIDRVFISNFFEHITREEILGTLREVRRVLRPTGKLLVLQPNIRYCARDYWMFFDHITPIDDRGLAEAFAAQGLVVEHSIARFLPYTTKSTLPSHRMLVRAYLRVPLAWRVLGGQAFMVARPDVR